MGLVTITKDVADPYNTQCAEYEMKGKLLDCVNNFLPPKWEDDPWICVLQRDGKRYHPLRSEWAEVELEGNDKVHLLPAVGDFLSIVLAIVVIILVVAVLFLINPSAPDAPESGDPVFSIDGKSNKAKLNQPIEDCYGRNKIWSSYIMSPYTLYSNQRQYLYQRFILGWGVHTIEDYLIDDTSTNGNPNISILDTNAYQTNIGQHGYNNVALCRSVNGIEMIASNQNGYAGAVGPYAINPPDTVIQMIANDVSLPNGAYSVNKKGKTRAVDVGLRWEVREIDRNGAPVTGTWHVLKDWYTNYATAQAQRITFYNNAPYPARWEIRCTRTDQARTDTKGTDVIYWDLCKGYRSNLQRTWTRGDYEGWTDYFVQTLAAQNTQANRHTALTRREIYWWSSLDPFPYQGWNSTLLGAPTYSHKARNPIWVMVEILRRPWGGNLRDDELDLYALEAAANQAEAAGETFDWCFTNSTTVWEAIKICCLVCRCTPIFKGGQFSVIRDVPDNIPVALFNRESIIEGSLKIRRRLWNNDQYDGLKATYLDHETWRNETVLATVGTQTGSNPKTTNLRGVTNRDQALKLTNYLWGTEFYNRQIIVFETNYSGIHLTYGDMIKVCTDVSANGQDGHVTALDQFYRVFTLSEKPIFKDGETHTITFRKKNGDAYGPFEVVPVAGQEYQVELADPLGQVDPTFIPIASNHEPPLYIFGETNSDGYLCKISKVATVGYDKLQIECVVENFGRFAQDAVTAPPIYREPLVPIPLPPDMTGLEATGWNESTRVVSFQFDSNSDADYYRTQYSLDDGETWIIISSNTTQTTGSFTVPSDFDVVEDQIFLSVEGYKATSIAGYGDPLVIAFRADAPILLTDDETTPNELQDTDLDEDDEIVQLRTF